MFKLRVIYLFFMAALCFSCGYDDIAPPDHVPSKPTPIPNTKISALHEMYRSGGVRIEEDVIVEGIVTTSDSCGNFYKCMMIQDETGAAEMRLGIYDIYTVYRPGSQVCVQLNGLALGMYQGSLQIGIENSSGSGYEVEDINSSAIASAHILHCDNSLSITPLPLTISQINISHIGKLVEVAGGYFTQGGKRTWSGERTLSEKYGVSVTVYTSSYATFAEDTLPEDKVILRGIVTQYKNKLQIKISSPRDVVPDPT